MYGIFESIACNWTDIPCELTPITAELRYLTSAVANSQTPCAASWFHISSISESSTPAGEVEMLRQRRLQREKMERKKAAILLSTCDIYGISDHVPDTGPRVKYNDQFNPHINRHSRWFGRYMTIRITANKLFTWCDLVRFTWFMFDATPGCPPSNV